MSPRVGSYGFAFVGLLTAFVRNASVKIFPSTDSVGSIPIAAIPDLIAMPKLRVVDIQNSAVTPEGYTALKNGRPNLRIIATPTQEGRIKPKPAEQD